MAPLQILISGGGVAGNALAFWLSQMGHSITVIERFDCLRTTGLQIDLRGHGIEVLKRMGLEQSFRSRAAPEQGWQLVNRSGKRKAYFPANKSGKGRQGITSEFEIMRGDLVRLLYDANKDKVRYIFGASIEHFEETQNHIEVRFENGNTEQFDLLVGADGQWSRTRARMLGPETPDALYPIHGQYIAYFIAPQPVKAKEEYIATMYMAPGRKWTMTRRHSPNEIQVYLGCMGSLGPLKDVRRGDVKAEKEALAEIFHGAGWRLDDLVEAMKGADNFYCERLGVVKLPSWSKGRVTLVGDAAYCSSANTGMGTTSGVVGAYILAGEIAQHCGIPADQQQQQQQQSGTNDMSMTTPNVAAALAAYEAKFRPFMDQVQEGVLEEKNGFMFPATSFGIAVFNCLAGVASLLKLNVADWALKENIKNWNLPDYDEMVRMVSTR